IPRIRILEVAGCKPQHVTGMFPENSFQCNIFEIDFLSYWGISMPREIEIDELRAEILGRYDSLSNRLQQAARYTLEHPNEVALETVTELARRAGVQPSVFVRLSQAFDFSGFSEFQKVFQGALALRSPSYGERIRLMREVSGGQIAAEKDIPRQFIEINRNSLAHLAESLNGAAFEKAV